MFECVALFTFIYFRSDQVHGNSREISETVLSSGEAFIYFDPYHVHCNKKIQKEHRTQTEYLQIITVH